MARYDDLDTKTIAYTTFMSCLLLVIIILTVQALSYNWLDEVEEARVVDQGYKASDATIREQFQTLDGYQWVDVVVPPEPGQPEPKAGEPQKTVKKLQIPIERAKQLLLNELKKSNEAAPQT